MKKDELVQQLHGLQFILNTLLHRSNGTIIIKKEQRDKYVQLVETNKTIPMINIDEGPGDGDITVKLISDLQEIDTYRKTKRAEIIANDLDSLGFISDEDLVKKLAENDAEALAAYTFLGHWVAYLEATKGESEPGHPVPEIPAYLKRVPSPIELPQEASPVISGAAVVAEEPIPEAPAAVEPAVQELPVEPAQAPAE